MEDLIIIEDVKQLKKQFGVSFFSSYPAFFELNIEGLTADEKKKYQAELEKYAGQCGCKTGQNSTIVFICIWLGLQIAQVKFPFSHSALNFMIFAFSGAFAGKMTGLVKAKLMLRRVISEMEGRLNSEESHLKTI